ncbi:MAG: PEGA domain-containing protein [Spirochaetota bacterium]
MRKTTALMMALAFLLPAAVPASNLFVTSAPIGAEVTVNGTAYGTTPLLVRDLEPGIYEVGVIKPGYAPASERIELAGDEARAVELRPEPDLFVGAFSADETIVDGTVYDRQESTLVLPSGTYELETEGRRLQLTPVYPNEGALAAARIATVAGGIAAILSTVEDVLVGDADSYFTSYLPSPATITMWTIAAGAGGFWIGLAADRRAYEERMVVRPFAGTLTPAEAERFFRDGEAALEAGNLSLALTHYTRVVADGGDSEYIPDALYKSGQIYSVSGDAELASRMLELLVSELPAPDVYDRALKSLADAYVALGRYDEAIARLEQMVFYDPLYEPPDIAGEIEAVEQRRDAEAAE